MRNNLDQLLKNGTNPFVINDNNYLDDFPVVKFGLLINVLKHFTDF